MKKLLFGIMFGYLCFRFTMYAFDRWHDFFLVGPAGPGVVKSIESSLLPTASVTRVTDGDTVVLDNGETVRLIGIDSPEVYPAQECYGKESGEAVRAWLVGKKVSLEKDISEVDRYERKLRYIWIGDEMVNEEIVRRGWARARVYEPDTMYENELSAAQYIAQSGNLGMWSQESGCTY